MPVICGFKCHERRGFLLKSRSPLRECNYVLALNFKSICVVFKLNISITSTQMCFMPSLS